jgi:hypothetical protein
MLVWTKTFRNRGEYNDIVDAGADRESGGSPKYLAFGDADMDLAYAGANKKLA